MLGQYISTLICLSKDVLDCWYAKFLQQDAAVIEQKLYHKIIYQIIGNLHT